MGVNLPFHESLDILASAAPGKPPRASASEPGVDHPFFQFIQGDISRINRNNPKTKLIHPIWRRRIGGQRAAVLKSQRRRIN